MSQYLDKDGSSRIAENFLSKQAEQDAILRNLQFDLKEAEHALVKTIQGPAPLNIRALTRPLDDYLISGNTVQDGMPSPEVPVDVMGCGVWDETQQSYKLPLTIGGTEHPIYLGQVETTRKIKKLVLTGEENWSGTSKFRIGLSGQIGTVKPLCTHYIGSTVAAYADLNDGYITVNGGINQTLCIFDSQNQIDVQTWKSYLATEYTNGTPVTIWYILATPETAVVNEPLHKISTYADTISYAQSGVEISTTEGFNAITTDTTVLPSNIEVKGVINNA